MMKTIHLMYTLILSAFFFFQCSDSDDKITGNATQIGNPQLSLKIFNPDGSPADSAKVSLFKVDEKEVFAFSYTDAKGMASFNDLTGNFNLWVEKNAFVTYVKSLEFTPESKMVLERTLEKEVILSVGKNIALQGMEIQILGSDKSLILGENENALSGFIPGVFSMTLQASDGRITKEFDFVIDENSLTINEEVDEKIFVLSLEKIYDLFDEHYEYSNGMISDLGKNNQNCLYDAVANRLGCEEQDYKTTTLGTQIWMAENLNFRTLTGSSCYEEKAENCQIYGRLYHKQAALAGDVEVSINEYAQGVCPNGWHVPNQGDWNILVDYIMDKEALVYDAESSYNGNGVAPYIMAKSGAGVCSSGVQIDAYGFSGLPAGEAGIDSYSGLGEGASWWVSNNMVQDHTSAWSAVCVLPRFEWNKGGVYDPEGTSVKYSVRCLKDEGM